MKNGLDSFVEKIKKNFSIGEPIFPKEILALFSFSRQQVYSYLKEAIKLNQIKKVDGYYYIPKYENIFGVEDDNSPIYSTIIKKKYLGDKKNRIGVYGGSALENRFNLSEQVPIVEDIISNNVRVIKKKKRIGNKTVLLRRPYITITNENYNIYLLLQIFNDAPIEMIENRIYLIENYIKDNKITYKKVYEIIKAFPQRVNNKIKKSGVKFYDR